VAGSALDVRLTRPEVKRPPLRLQTTGEDGPFAALSVAFEYSLAGGRREPAAQERARAFGDPLAGLP
jgi:hypothetical protein